MSKITVIAEAGVNHNGDLDLAKSLIEVAAKAGADFVKFQIFIPNELATENASLAEYQRDDLPFSKTQRALLNRLQLEFHQYEELREFSKRAGIGIFATAFDLPSLKFLSDLNEPFIKVASGEITNRPFLEFVGNQGVRILLSTGMSTLEEIAQGIAVLRSAGAIESNITLMQCTSSYPTKMSEANIKAMVSLREKFQLSVGFSDHTEGIEATIAAVALGATVIEKHFTLDKSMSGPDHGASLDPSQLKSMIRAIRNIELALGDGVKKVMPGELENRILARKSIVAIKNIREGDIFTEHNIATKRPGNGISAMAWDQLIGTKSMRNYEVDDFI